MAYTEEQQKAIDTEGQNIIVSAGAGSGKTKVLTARVIRKLKNGIDINKLLVLTFTNEAANEMKSRIRNAIIENNLLNQLSLLDSAYITTFDSYTLSLVKKYHYILNISKDINIIDSNIITIQKYRILDEIFNNLYGTEKFDKLITDFCLKDDRNMRKFIIDISNKLDLLVDKDNYLENYINKYFSQAFFEQIKVEYEELIKNNIEELKNIYQELLPYLNNEMSKKVTTWLKPLFDGNNYQTYQLFKNISTPRFVKLSEEATTIKEDLKNKVNQIKSLLSYDNIENAIDSVKSTKEYIEIIIQIVKLLDQNIIKYKNKYNIYEFNDISHMAIKIVKDNLAIRNEIKEYFNEIMLDEYQDTSTIQETFINYIANNNVYMVGDIKQSIYRFRNANPYIFYEKYRKYTNKDGGIKIDLTKNFRSRKETLDNINEIFNLIMDMEVGNADYKQEHNMIYGNTAYDLEDTKANNSLEIYNYKIDKKSENSYEKELFIISQDIQEKINNKYQVLDKDTNKLRNLKYSDICIITDRNKYLPTYKKILEYFDIPSVIYMDEILTNDSTILAIKNLINLVAYVNQEIYDEKFKYAYTSVARSFIYELSDDEIYQTFISNDFENTEIVKIAKTINISAPLVTIINEILDKYNIYLKLTKLTEINKNIVRINNLLDIATNVSILDYDINDFINYLDEIKEMNLNIKYNANTASGNAVKIMNIHKSKGLEFSICYYTNLDNKFTISDITSKFLISEKYGIILPYMLNNELNNTILKSLYENDYYKSEISEKIRLFYVALTRSREKIIILANINQDNQKYKQLVPANVRLKYRSFLDIVNSINNINKYLTQQDATVKNDYLNITIKDIEKNTSDTKIDKHKIDIKYEKIINKHFSKEKKLLNDIETIKKMEYGTKIHELLEYEDFRNTNNPVIKNIINHFGDNYLQSYHEYEFKYTINNEEYHGIIDLMLEYNDVINIIDYKLKDITDKEYLKQLIGYKNYIKELTNKKVKIYLYSITNNDIKEIKYEK